MPRWNSGSSSFAVYRVDSKQFARSFRGSRVAIQRGLAAWQHWQLRGFSSSFAVNRAGTRPFRGSSVALEQWQQQLRGLPRGNFTVSSLRGLSAAGRVGIQRGMPRGNSSSRVPRNLTRAAFCQAMME